MKITDRAIQILFTEIRKNKKIKLSDAVKLLLIHSDTTAKRPTRQCCYYCVDRLAIKYGWTKRIENNIKVLVL